MRGAHQHGLPELGVGLLLSGHVLSLPQVPGKQHAMQLDVQRSSRLSVPLLKIAL